MATETFCAGSSDAQVDTILKFQKRGLSIGLKRFPVAGVKFSFVLCVDKANNTIRHIAAVNRRPLPPDFDTASMEEVSETALVSRGV